MDNSGGISFSRQRKGVLHFYVQILRSLVASHLWVILWVLRAGCQLCFGSGPQGAAWPRGSVDVRWLRASGGSVDVRQVVVLAEHQAPFSSLYGCWQTPVPGP